MLNSTVLSQSPFGPDGELSFSSLCSLAPGYAGSPTSLGVACLLNVIPAPSFSCARGKARALTECDEIPTTAPSKQQIAPTSANPARPPAAPRLPHSFRRPSYDLFTRPPLCPQIRCLTP